MLYVGSLVKIYPLLAAFELRRRVTWQAKKDMIKIGLSTTTTAGWQNKVFAELKKVWQPRLDAAFRDRGLLSKFPKLAEVVEFSPDGTAQLREEFLGWIRRRRTTTTKRRPVGTSGGSAIRTSTVSLLPPGSSIQRKRRV